MKTLFSILLSALLLFSAMALEAQGDNSKSNMYGGLGYFMPGYHFLNLSDLNVKLTNDGYPEIQNGTLSMGGGGFYIVKNFLLGGEGYGLIGGSVENNEYQVIHSGGCGYFNFGYLLFSRPSFLFAPVLGIGGGGISVNLKDKNLYPDAFDDVLENPGRESVITNGGFLLNFSLFTSYMIVGERSENGAGGFFLGLKAGYVLNTGGNNWTMNDEKLADSPSAGMSGPYFSLVIGGGGVGR